VKHSPRELLGLLATPVGRREVAYGLRFRAWPIVAAAARVNRRRIGTRTRFVAVVGSFGKTTTARAIRAALGGDFRRHVSANSWTVLAWRVLAVRPGDRHAVIEAGISAPGQMARYATWIRPDVTVVTSVGSEHNRSLGTLERTRDEKAEMVRALPRDGVAVLNGDDPNVLWMRGETRARVVTYGLGPENDVVGSDLQLDWPRGMRLEVAARGERRSVRVPLLGEKMAYPVLAATAVALGEGRTLDQIVPTFADLAAAPGRLETVALPDGVWLLRDEYKAALETVHAALDVLAAIPARRKIVVLGDIAEPMGPQGPLYRDLGARLAAIAARVVVVGIQMKPIATGARRAGMPRDAIVDAGRSTARATEILRRELRPGDVVLLKGRDTERLDRIALALLGERVACDVSFCDARKRCRACPMLARGWRGRPTAHP
jgi:UDP-N-acetylmuramyl pentapeptide synthase